MEEELQLRPWLSIENSEKIRKVMGETNMSASDVVNRILNAVSAVEMAQVISFIVEVRPKDSPPRKLAMRRHSNWQVKL